MVNFGRELDQLFTSDFLFWMSLVHGIPQCSFHALGIFSFHHHRLLRTEEGPSVACFLLLTKNPQF
jgi:hypothetical protein